MLHLMDVRSRSLNKDHLASLSRGSKWEIVNLRSGERPRENIHPAWFSSICGIPRKTACGEITRRWATAALGPAAPEASPATSRPSARPPGREARDPQPRPESREEMRVIRGVCYVVGIKMFLVSLCFLSLVCHGTYLEERCFLV